MDDQLSQVENAGEDAQNSNFYFAGTIQQLADLTDRLEDPGTGQTLEIEQVKVNLPIELNVSITDEDTITLFSSPPTQTVETTVLPVFHRMKLTIVATDGQ